jgi:ABC-type branched-subunit amino acid transport system substrate-binding protein
MLAGEMMVRGACLAAEYVREHGGICGGRQLELVLANDQATAVIEPMARSAVGELAKLTEIDKVLAVLGNWMVRTTSAVVDASHRLGVPHFGAAKLAAIPAGESPANRGGPFTVVVISITEKGDRLVESLDVKALAGWGNPVRSVQGGEQPDRP